MDPIETNSRPETNNLPENDTNDTEKSISNGCLNSSTSQLTDPARLMTLELQDERDDAQLKLLAINSDDRDNNLSCELKQSDESLFTNELDSSGNLKSKDSSPAPSSNSEPTIELRFLVRRREAGALIGKRGFNIKRLRETFRSSMFSIPDTGNGPERVVCIATNEKSLDAILTDLTCLFAEKSLEKDEQIELKLLIHFSHAGSIIGIGGQSIKKLRNDSKAAIKIYEMCCPLSNERVCAIKAKPLVVVNTIKLINSILNENPIKGTIKPYDALYFDLSLVDKYGGYLPDDLASLDQLTLASHHHHLHPYEHQMDYGSCHRLKEFAGFQQAKHCHIWRLNTADCCNSANEPTRHQNVEAQDESVMEVTEFSAKQDNFPKGHLACASKERCNASLEPSTGQLPSTDQAMPVKTLYQHHQFNQYQPAIRNQRYHPYSPATPMRNPSIGIYSHRLQQYNPFPMNANRFTSASHLIRLSQGAIFPPAGLPRDRCRHIRPCFCMLFPVTPTEVASSVHQTSGKVSTVTHLNNKQLQRQSGGNFVNNQGKSSPYGCKK